MRRIIQILSIQFLFAASAHAFTTVHATEAYEPTKKTWVKVYEQLVKNGASVKGTTYIMPVRGNGYKDRLHKNKARDTIIFIPNTTSLDEPIDIIFYFHGLGGFKERDFKTRVLEHTTSIPPEKNYVIIIPEMPWSKHTSTPRTRQGRVFTGEEEFSDFVMSSQNIINSHFASCTARACTRRNKTVTLGTAVLLGHSAGGSTLMSISRSGGLNWLYDKAGATSVKVIFSDASYGHWLDIAWKSFRPYIENTEFLVLTRKWDKPYRHAKRFLNKFKKPPVNIKHIVFNRKTTHAGIGDQSFDWVYGFNVDSGCGEGESK